MSSVYMGGTGWDNFVLVHGSPDHRQPHPNLREETASERGSGAWAACGAGWRFPLTALGGRMGGCALWGRKGATSDYLVPRGAGGRDR